MPSFRRLISLLLLPLLAACGFEETSFQKGTTLVRGDIESFSYSNVVGHSRESRTLELFEKVFGGNTEGHVKEFVQLRAKRFFNWNDRGVGILNSTEKYQNWQPPKTTFEKRSNEPALIMAANFGTMLWLQGQVEGNKPSLFWFGEEVSVDSTRSGIILLGKGYSDSVKFRGKVQQVSQIVRKETLVHESRHSDCTDGLSQETILAARNAASYQDFLDKTPDFHCGHTHILCPAGHELAGIPACDNEAWGAYAVGWLYSAALAQSPYTRTSDWQQHSAIAIDSKSRILVEDFAEQEPDMSHEEPTK